MAFFNQSDKQTNNSSNTTTIAAGSSFTGKIEIDCELHIDGRVDGDITSKGTVTVGKSGVLISNLKAKKLIVTGKFTGNADCDEIELISGGEAEGKLISSSLVIDSNSSFQGESQLKKNNAPPRIDEKVLDDEVLDKIVDKVVEIGSEPDPFRGEKKPRTRVTKKSTA